MEREPAGVAWARLSVNPACMQIRHVMRERRRLSRPGRANLAWVVANAVPDFGQCDARWPREIHGERQLLACERIALSSQLFVTGARLFANGSQAYGWGSQ